MSAKESCSVTATTHRASDAKLQGCGWGSLAPGVVDGIVRILQRRRRWKLDGPALRLVNKHWAWQIGQHIVAVRPCWTKVLTKQDATSLLHFPQITALDVSPFLHGFRRREARAELKEEDRKHIVEAFKSELDRVTGILVRLPNLTHLDLDASLQQRQGHPFCIEDCEEWSRLERITSLSAYGAHSVSQPVPWGHQDQKPWYLDQRGEWDAEHLCRLVHRFPQLRRLKARTYSSAVPGNLSELQRLESLNLEAGGSVEFVLAVSDLGPLEELDAITFPFSRVDLLGQLRQLKSLTLDVWNATVLATPAFFQVLENLRCLVLRSDRQWLRLPDNFVRSAIELQSLTLSQFQLRGQDILTMLTDLKKLTLRYCFMVDGRDFLMHLKKVKFLGLVNLVDRRGHPLQLVFDEDSLPDIRSLSLIPVSETSTLKSIAQMKTLEMLELGPHTDATVAGFTELQNLPHLRDLSLRVTLAVTSLPSLLSLEFLTNLEKLSFSGRKLHPLERQKVEELFKQTRRA